jgi:dephospho-CoA kinase
MRWIGLTGGIATGKSSATKVLRNLGYRVIDADEVAHGVTALGAPVLPLLFSTFGDSIREPNGGLNRRALGQKVFGHPEEIRKLEAILHPLIRAAVDVEKRQFEAAGASLAFYDVPLLFEKNLSAEFDAVILVYASEELQITRMQARNGLTRAEAVARIRSQWPIEQKRSLTTYIVDNSRDLAWLESEIRRVLSELGVK